MRVRMLFTMGALLAIPVRALATLSPDGGCETAIARAEAASHVPDEFLSAIARVESGRQDPSTGMAVAWPWTVNANGQGSFYASKEQAVEAVKALQKAGVRSIDVGCLQVNLMHHPDAFASLEQAFDPDANARFAASFLVSLFGQTGSWPHAAAAYHSQTPTIGADYQKKVLAAWALPRSSQAAGAPQPAEASAAQEAAVASPPPSWGGRAVTGFLPAPPVTSRPPGLAGRDLAAYRIVPVPLAWRSGAQFRRRPG